MGRKLLFWACAALVLAMAVDAKKPDNKPGKAVKPPACVAGVDGCAKCTKNGKKCAQCLATTSTTGVYVTAAGVCAPCKDAGCATCRKSSGNCVTCLSGLAKKGNKCSECGAGFVVTKKGRCKACPKGCASCDKSSKCKVCAEGVLTRSGKCKEPEPEAPENPETPEEPENPETPTRR